MIKNIFFVIIRMLLGVTIINKINNEKITIDSSPNVFLDDSIKNVKEKLFLYNPEFIPNFLKVQIGDKTVTNPNDILYEHFDFFKLDEPIIYISNVQDIITMEPENLLEDSMLFETVLTDLNKEYTDLTHEDLLFLVKLQILNKKYSIISVDYSEIEGYITTLQNKRNNMLRKIKDNIVIQEFNKIASNVEFNLLDNIILYNDINLNITGDNFESGTKGVFIKLNEIFNIIELNNDIPFIALGKRSGSSRLPQIKIYNKLINTVNDKEIKSWVLNEKKKLNEATYKIIKGLMIKTNFGTNNYLTLNILANGLLNVNLKLTPQEQQQYSNLNELINDIKVNVNNIIDYLNTFNGVFLKSKRLSTIDNSIVTVESIDTSIETSTFIDKIKFESIIKNKYISENILELKRTESLDILSAYYKKFKSRESSLEDIKGITINIRDNQYKEESSIIKIFGANSYTQTLIILLNILIITEMANLLKNDGMFEDFVKKRKIREKTNKKKLKEQGINFDSRECQAIRQPTLMESSENQDVYSIIHNNKNYKCNSIEYPYPGFTKNNIVCCFKYNQSGNESYIKNINPDSLTILVEPSNFKITIDEKKKNFETYVIRIISDYQDGFDESNSMPRYYYLSDKTNDLIPINNKLLINDIEKEDNIWLDRVPLAQIIYPSATNKCSHKPNLNNKSSIHAPCSEYKKEKHGFFGYTSKSIPCCFDKEKDTYITRKKKESDITKHYIIQSSDKPLNYQKIGILPYDISTLFNKLIIDNTINKFYRMGVIQNNNSFLNVVLLGINNTIKQKNINNHTDFKQIIINYLQNNPLEFNKLNNGNISIKYSLNEYINYINSDSLLNWIDFLDLLERLLNINILIFDTNDSDSRLLCRPIPLNTKKLDRPFLILIKRKNTFELIIQLLLYSDKKNDVVKTFDYDNKIIKFITDYYYDSCIKENIYPKNYPYIPINNHQYVIEKLMSQKDNTSIGDIKYQIKNSFNKINFLMTKRGVIIPVLQTGIIDNINLKVVSFSSLIKQKNSLLSLQNYINAFKVYNTIFFDKVEIIGIVDSNINEIGGIMTNFGSIIPYLKNNTIHNIPTLDFKYYLDIDEKLQLQNDPVKSEFEIYNLNTDKIRVNIFNLKTTIGNEIYSNQDIKNNIENIIKNPFLPKESKINSIVDIFIQFKLIQNNLTPDSLTFLKSIANEMINDNKENLILHNIITNDTFNKNDVKIRTSESILLNIDDIRQWIKNYKTLE